MPASPLFMHSPGCGGPSGIWRGQCGPRSLSTTTGVFGTRIARGVLGAGLRARRLVCSARAAAFLLAVRCRCGHVQWRPWGSCRLRSGPPLVGCGGVALLLRGVMTTPAEIAQFCATSAPSFAKLASNPFDIVPTLGGGSADHRPNSANFRSIEAEFGLDRLQSCWGSIESAAISAEFGPISARRRLDSTRSGEIPTNFGQLRATFAEFGPESA